MTGKLSEMTNKCPENDRKMTGKRPENVRNMSGKCPENVRKMFENVARFSPKVDSQTNFDHQNRLRTQNYLRNEPETSQKALTATIFTSFLDAFSDPKSEVFWCRAVTVHR